MIEPIEEIDVQYESIGKTLAELRESKEITQSDLVDLIEGMTQPYISKIENGQHIPNFRSLTRWAGALGYDVRIRLVPKKKTRGRRRK